MTNGQENKRQQERKKNLEVLELLNDTKRREQRNDEEESKIRIVLCV